MAHIFDDDWRSSVIEQDGTKRRDGVFRLRINEQTGEVDTTASTHDGRRVRRGNARRQQQTDTIEIVNDRGNRYHGVLAVNTPEFQMICGFRTLNFEPLADERVAGGEPKVKADEKGGSKEKDKDRFTQEQIIWVATKP